VITEKLAAAAARLATARGVMIMKQLLLSALVLGAMSSAALAAEPLTEQQMDNVTAGQQKVTAAFGFVIPFLDGLLVLGAISTPPGNT
jgi:hypothetical protein